MEIWKGWSSRPLVTDVTWLVCGSWAILCTRYPKQLG